MGEIKVTRDAGGIPGLTLIEPKVFGDERGYFIEAFNARDYRKAGIDVDFVQDNESMSCRGVIRGLHFQINYPQDKLVRAMSGEIYDVAVDLRPDSPTFGKHFGVILSGENKRQLFVPKNFAHGFVVRSETAVFCYKVTDYYHPDDEGGIAFDDATLGVDWALPEGFGKSDLILSAKDRVNPSFADWCQSRDIPYESKTAG